MLLPPTCRRLKVSSAHVVVRSGPGCKLVRCEPIKASVGAVIVVVVPPIADDLPGMGVAGEQVLVQGPVPQPCIEAFDETIPHRLAGGDVVPFDLPVLLPRQHGV